MDKVIVPMEFDVEEIWSEVMGSGWEYSDWFENIEYDNGDWETPCNATLYHWDKDDEEKTVITKFTPEMVVAAYAKLFGNSWTHCGGSPIDDGDACTSDAVLQHMVYGDWIYG
jgi:hypothetical protein